MVIIEEDIYGVHDLVVVRWDIADSKQHNEQVLTFGQDMKELTPLFGLDRLTLAYPSFSPDGNWYVVGLVGPAVLGKECRLEIENHGVRSTYSGIASEFRRLTVTAIIDNFIAMIYIESAGLTWELPT